jgi:DNA-binding beta-propeller fold protein YncE
LSNNVTILGAENLAFVANVPVGGDPEQVAFDPADSMDYICNVNSGNVTVMDGVGTNVGSISLSSGPIGIAFDQKNLDMYVTIPGGNEMAVIHGTTVLRYIFLAATWAPVGMAFSDTMDQMLVTDVAFDQVDVIS